MEARLSQIQSHMYAYAIKTIINACKLHIMSLWYLDTYQHLCIRFVINVLPIYQRKMF